MTREKAEFNNWALKKWSLIFSAETRFDPTTYLLASLVPISYVKIHEGTNYAVVDLEELRTHTPMALKGCKYLVEQGAGMWLEFVENPKDTAHLIEDNSWGLLAIGKLKGFKSVTFFMEEVAELKQEEPVDTVQKQQTENAFAETMQVIDEMFVTYNKFCEMAGLTAKGAKIYRQAKNIINRAQSAQLTRAELLEYLYIMNAVMFDFSDVPTVTNKHKELAVATQITSKVRNEELIPLIPYYVQNWHNLARKGNEETSIYNLSFNLSTILTKMRGGKRKKIASNEEDNF